jgi:hypothetical protein
MIPSWSQFTPERLKERKAQINADAAWAKETWEAKGGDKAAHTFKPDFKGQSYEQQLRGDKEAK